MFRKLLMLICIASNVMLNCADPSEQTKDDYIFLQRHQVNPPSGYRFLTACKTQDNNTYLAVFTKLDKVIATDDNPMKILIGSAKSTTEATLGTHGCEGIEDGGFAHAVLKGNLLLKLVGLSSDSYFCYIKRCQDGKSGAILADTAIWQSEDVREHNPNIPKNTWLKVLQ